MSNHLPPDKDWRRRRRDDPRLQWEHSGSNEFMAPTMSSISEQESPRSDFTNNYPYPRYIAPSPSFDRDTSLGPTQEQSSQLDVFSSEHSSNGDPRVFSSNGPASAFNYPGASSPPVHQYDLQPNSSTPSRPSALSCTSGSTNGRAGNLQYGQLDQGMVGQLGTMLQYLPPGPQKCSTTEIRAFSQLSREEQRAANQARLVKCGWTDDRGLQTCTAVTSAKDMRKHIENYHNVSRRETKQVCRWIHCGSSEQHLYKHIGIVHFGLQKITCEYCHREFSRTDLLTTHLRSCRGGEN
ncbi:hypothetical protein C8J56DRAFT_1048552 [Mycena floridula]|nr:hypothetical protein C8J56DRAFT_1048552 [Mycena floridula]